MNHKLKEDFATEPQMSGIATKQKPDNGYISYEEVKAISDNPSDRITEAIETAKEYMQRAVPEDASLKAPDVPLFDFEEEDVE